MELMFLLHTRMLLSFILRPPLWMGKKVGDRVLIKVNDSYSYYVKILSVESGKDDESLKISDY